MVVKYVQVKGELCVVIIIANALLTFRHYWEGESNHIYPLLEHVISKVSSKSSVSNHDWSDGMVVTLQVGQYMHWLWS